MKLRILFSIFSIMFTLINAAVPGRTFPAQAICMVPVANAFNQYVRNKFPEATPQQIKELYQNILATNVKNSDLIRTHQFLLHQIVTVLEENNGELLVRASNHFCQNKPDEKVFNTYAVLMEEFVFFDEIFALDKDIKEKLPPSYNWKDGKSFEPTSQVFTLNSPFTSKEDNRIFSLGTRFKMCRPHNPKDAQVDVYALVPFLQTVDNKTFRAIFLTDTFPLEAGLIDVPRTPEEKEQCIVEQFLKASTGEKRIPTAWGGNSATALFKKEDYKKTTLALPDGTTIEGYTRQQKSGIQSGFTLGELNMALERLCGVPSFMKNTTTWNHLGDHLKPDQDIKRLYCIAGPGYLGRVISVEDNLVADIRSYSQHDGIARLVKLSENFKGIETYADLVNAYRTGQPLQLLNDKQEVIATFKPGTWNILSFSTEYNTEKWTNFAEKYA